MRSVQFLLAIVAIGTCGLAQARTLTMVVPFNAGGNTDIVARQFEPPFSKSLGTTGVIKNISGASGTVGTGQVAHASQNTLGYIPVGPLAIQPVFKKNLPYQPDDFRYICQTTSSPMFLMVSKNSDIKSFKQLVAKSQEQPILYGSSGPGTLPQIAIEALASKTDLKASGIPYSGTGPAMNALAGNEIQVFADTAAVLKNYDLRPIAVFTQSKMSDYPNVPTMADLGLSLSFSVWQGVVAPKNWSEDRINKAAQACKKAVDAPKFKDFAKRLDVTIHYRGPSAFKKFAHQKSSEYANVIKHAGIGQ